MTRQKKLRLSGSLYRFLIICTDMTCQKGKRNFSYRGLFRLLCVKGAVGASRLRDCFFYNPSRRGLQVCFAHSQIPPTAARFPNPSRRGLQACFAYLQILQPLRGFRTRLGEACKRASHTRKSLYTREPFYQLCFSSIFFLISYLKKARLSGGLFVSLFCVCCGFFNRRFFGSFCGFL